MICYLNPYYNIAQSWILILFPVCFHGSRDIPQDWDPSSTSLAWVLALDNDTSAVASCVLYLLFRTYMYMHTHTHVYICTFVCIILHTISRTLRCTYIHIHTIESYQPFHPFNSLPALGRLLESVPWRHRCLADAMGKVFKNAWSMSIKASIRDHTNHYVIMHCWNP